MHTPLFYDTIMTTMRVEKKKDYLRLGIMKGFEYAYPERKATLAAIQNNFERVVTRFGFQEIDGPMLQPLEFFSVKSGSELLANTYTFSDNDDSTLVLRPEITPTLAFMIARQEQSFKFPIRWWSNPTLFRKENPQKGRKRQFSQLNVDIFDLESSKRKPWFDEAEVILVAIAILESFGLREKDFVVSINSRALLNSLCTSLTLPSNRQAQLLGLLDKSEKISQATFTAELSRILPDEKQRRVVQTFLSCRSIEAIQSAEELSGRIDPSAIEALVQLFALMKAYKKEGYISFCPTIVRGLGYYTGMVFEVFERGENAELKRAILGGGRYGELTKAIGGKLPITGVGFGLGQVPLEELLKAKKLPLPTATQELNYYLAVQNASNIQAALALGQQLRDSGVSLLADASLATGSPQSISKQLQQAVSVKANNVLLVFPEEWKDEKIAVKNLATKKQEVLLIKDLLLLAKKK